MKKNGKVTEAKKSLAETLRAIAAMDSCIINQDPDEIDMVDAAMKMFRLTRNELQLLATFFATETGIDGYGTRTEPYGVYADLIQHGYAMICADGLMRLTPEARDAIEGGEPYIIADADKDNAVFLRRLSSIVQYDANENILSSDLWDVVTEYPRSSIVQRLEGYDFLDNAARDLLLMLCSHLHTHGPVEWAMPTGLSAGEKTSVLASMSSLLEHGLITAVAPEGEPDAKRGKVPPVMLSPVVAGVLFEGCARFINFAGALSRYGTLIKPDDVRQRDLFYNEEIAHDVERLSKAFLPERYAMLTARLALRGKNEALTCLLYGPPGTGKTELALQMAKAAGRTILKADVAKLTGSYVGESERNYRALFCIYRFAAQIMAPMPVLLLNEVDAFLSQRTQVARAIDKYENNVQDILLEELEAFEGILVATTNHTANLDEAYDRRFLVKLQVSAPDPATRKRIWRDRMPELPEDMAAKLAVRYRLTGADIENVIAKVDLIATMDDRCPMFSDIAEQCRQTEIRVTGGTRRAVGYNAC